MDDVSRLMALEEIRQLKSRYFRAIDGKNWAALRQIFTDDVICDYRGTAIDLKNGIEVPLAATASILNGADDAVAACRAALQETVSVHHGFMPDIELTGAATAIGNWAMRDHVWFPPSFPLSELLGYGYYDETYERIGGVWRIKTLKLSRIKAVYTPQPAA